MLDGGYYSPAVVGYVVVVDPYIMLVIRTRQKSGLNILRVFARWTHGS
jgi:hypothetical protein